MNAHSGDATLCQPLTCQLETPYSDAEWEEFLICAKEHCTDPEIYTKHFLEQQEKKQIRDGIERDSLDDNTKMVAYHYPDDDEVRIAIWHPGHQYFIVASGVSGSLVTIYPMPARKFWLHVTGGQFTLLRWLRP